MTAWRDKLHETKEEGGREEGGSEESEEWESGGEGDQEPADQLVPPPDSRNPQSGTGGPDTGTVTSCSVDTSSTSEMITIGLVGMTMIAAIG